jgi:hypothetical protein
MIDQVPGLKPVFLIDNQKTLTKLVDPIKGEIDIEGNRKHRMPAVYSEAEFDVANRLMGVMRGARFALRTPNPTISEIVDSLNFSLTTIDHVFPRLLTAEGEYVEGLDINSLLPYSDNRPWDVVWAEINRLPKQEELDSPLLPRDDISGWKICPEGFDLLKFVAEELKCPQFVLSGIFNDQLLAMDESFRAQDRADRYLSGHRYVLRSRAIRSSHLHKALIHMIFKELGVPTVDVDEDPNTIDLIRQSVGVPGCLASTPEEALAYAPGACRLDLIREPAQGPLFQLGVDGDSLVELARKAYRWWQGESGVIGSEAEQGRDKKGGTSYDGPNLNLLAVATP